MSKYDDDKEWPPPCECGRPAYSGFLPDPFLADVWPEEDNPKRWWCDQCYDDRLDDI